MNIVKRLEITEDERRVLVVGLTRQRRSCSGKMGRDRRYQYGEAEAAHRRELETVNGLLAKVQAEDNPMIVLVSDEVQAAVKEGRWGVLHDEAGNVWGGLVGPADLEALRVLRSIAAAENARLDAITAAVP